MENERKSRDTIIIGDFDAEPAKTNKQKVNKCTESTDRKLRINLISTYSFP